MSLIRFGVLILSKLLTGYSVFALLLFCAEMASAQPVRCEGVFAGGLVLKSSVENSILELAKFRLDLDLSKVKGRTTIEKTVLEANFKEKEDQLVEFLINQKIMSRDEFRLKLTEEIVKLQGKEEKNKDHLKDEELERKRQADFVVDVANIDGGKAVFNPIPAGSFLMGKKRVPVTLTKSFAMMATPVTQLIWKTVVENERKIFGKSKLQEYPSFEVGDLHPVETVYPSEILQWIEILNDLSNLQSDSTLNKFIPGHRRGDVYRLPTEAEWEFVVSNRGQNPDPLFVDSGKSTAGDYAWFSENARGKTHPVAQKLPLNVDGQFFYDMFGNISEMMQDRVDSHGLREGPPGGTDPVGNLGDVYIWRGGNFNSQLLQLTPSVRGHGHMKVKYKNLGFRLVRERKP